MAATHTPKNALDFAKRMVYNKPVDDTALADVIMNLAADRIYFAKSWSWSVDQLDSVTLVAATDDYAITDPGDVLYLVQSDLQHPDGTIEPLMVVNSLAPEDVNKGLPRFIAQTSATNLRIKPTPQAYSAGAAPTAITWYKKTTTRIVTGANDTAAATLPFPDEWFSVYAEFVYYYALKYAQSPNAGSIQVGRQGGVATGQLAVAMAMLEVMKAAEPGFVGIATGREG